MASTKKRQRAKATANAVEAASVRRPYFFSNNHPLCRKLGPLVRSAVAPRNDIFHFIHRNPRKVLDRGKASARSLCHMALTHNHDRSAAARNLDLGTRDTHHAGAQPRFERRPRGTDR